MIDRQKKNEYLHVNRPTANENQVMFAWDETRTIVVFGLSVVHKLFTISMPNMRMRVKHTVTSFIFYCQYSCQNIKSPSPAFTMCMDKKHERFRAKSRKYTCSPPLSATTLLSAKYCIGVANPTPKKICTAVWLVIKFDVWRSGTF